MVDFLEHVGFYIKGVDYSSRSAHAGAVGSPFLLRESGGILHLGKLDRFHYLTYHTVAEDHDGETVFIGFVESVVHDVDGFLNGIGSVNEHVIIAVTATFDSLEIVGLRGLDTAESGAASDHIDYDAGKFGAANVADTLLFKANAGRARRSHRARAASGGAVYHIDGGDFAFRLNEAAAHFGQTLAEILRYLVLRGDGIAEEGSAPASHGGFGYGFVTFHKFFHRRSSYLSTVMATSGHIKAHEVHPIQPSETTSATK